jgi:hypothetical protein
LNTPTVPAQEHFSASGTPRSPYPSELTGLTAGTITGTDIDTDIKAVKDAVSAMNKKRKEQLDYYRHVNMFEEDFTNTVNALTEERKVVVLVDDLDRCRGESALMALEALRLFTGHARCVFVIAMDHQALIEAASAHFDKNEARGRHYLEKLINFPYYLPEARSDSISRALRKQLEFLADDNTMWQLIQLNMDGNPRRIRRFINTFNLAIAMMERGVKNLTEERQRQVAVLLMFRQEHPAFFEMLLHDGEAWAQLERAAGNRPDGIADLPQNLERLVKDDPRLLDAIASVAPSQTSVDPSQKGYDFPPHSTRDQISAFTKAMVLPRQPLSATTPTLVPAPGGPIS